MLYPSANITVSENHPFQLIELPSGNMAIEIVPSSSMIFPAINLHLSQIHWIVPYFPTMCPLDS